MLDALCAARRGGRQGPRAELLGPLYHALQQSQGEVSLPAFVRLAELLIEEDAVSDLLAEMENHR